MNRSRLFLILGVLLLSLTMVGVSVAADRSLQSEFTNTEAVVNSTQSDMAEPFEGTVTQVGTGLEGSAGSSGYGNPDAVLWDNGPLVTHPGACSGMDASRLQTDLGMNTLGFGHQFLIGNRMADDFTITDPGGWHLDQITFFAYQTGGPVSPSPITGVYYQIWDGPPNDPSSSIVFGDLTTNRLLSSVSPNMQRDSSSTTCANNRYIFADVASAGVDLPAGIYWIVWMTDGNLASGPWAPPVTILGQTTTGNAMQYISSSGTWGPALDGGTSTQQGMPFIIEGTISTPDIEVTPLTLHAEQPTNSVTQQNLQICNVGTSPLDWQILEDPGMLAGSMPFIPVSVEGKTETREDIDVSYTPDEIAAPSQPANPDAVLWDQPLSGVNQNAYVNQAFPDLPAYSSFLADDFVNTSSWSIQSIFIPGNGWNGFTTLLNATSLTWQIFADSGGVPAGDPSGGGAPPIWTLTLAPTDPSVVITNGSGGLPSNTQVNLATPIDLPPGHYWLVFYPTLAFTPGGQFGRQPADTTNGYTGQFINPGGAFGYGTSWQNWTVLGPAQTDIAFRLEGEIVQIPWLDEAPKSGSLVAGACNVVNVSFDSTGLAQGAYNGTLLVNSNDPDEPTVNVPVTLHVVAPPDISITPTSLESTQAPNTIKSQTLPICNVAGGTLNWNLWEGSGMLNQGISIPVSDEVIDKGGEPVSVGLAPTAVQGAPAPEHSFVLAGEPAYAVDIYLGKNVVHIPDTTNPGSWDVVANKPGNQYFAGDFISGDYTTLYAIDNALKELHAINTTTGVVTVIGPSLPIGSQTVTGMSWDPTTDTMYATATTGAVASLYTIDLNTGTPTFVADIAGAPFTIDIAFNGQGVLYGHEIALDVIMTINKTTGATTTIGPTGFSANFAQGMDFEDTTGILYLSAYNATTSRGELRVVDTTTGATALIGPFPGGTEVDAFAFATGSGFDIPWLSESPISGSAAAGGCQNVTVTFDSTGMPLGVYTGVLSVYSNDPDEPVINIPVTLNVGYHEFFLPIVLR